MVTADERPEGERAAARWLRARAHGARAPLAAAIGAGLADTALIVGQAALIAAVVHRAVIEEVPLSGLTGLLAALAGVMLARAVATWGRNAAGAAAAERVAGRVRDELARKLGALGPVGLAGRSGGALASTVVEQVDALEPYYAHFLPQLVLAVATPAALIAVVAAIDPLAGLLLLLAAPLVPLFMALIGMGAERLARREQRGLERISAHFLDRLRGLATLRIFRATEAAGRAIEAAADAYRQRSMAVLRVAFLSSAVLELISAVSIALVAIYVGLSLLGYLGFGPGPELGLFAGLFILLLAPEIFLPLRRLAQHYHDRAAALAGAEAIRSVVAEQPPAAAPAPPRHPPEREPGTGLPRPVPQPIRLQGVSVTVAEAGAPLLADVSLAIGAGERVVVSGPSGAGKSTLLALLAGFRRPDAGTLDVGGQPPPGPHGVAWVGQTPWLFHGSVRENLRIADPVAEDRTLWAALAAVDLERTVAALPEGLAAPLGEGGHGLSGGQAARLALARALLSGAPVLLLDEPLAGLDPASRDRVLASLHRIADGRRTVVLVAHDPEVHGWGERHLELRDGSIAEAGDA